MTINNLLAAINSFPGVLTTSSRADDNGVMVFFKCATMEVLARIAASAQMLRWDLHAGVDERDMTLTFGLMTRKLREGVTLASAVDVLVEDLQSRAMAVN